MVAVHASRVQVKERLDLALLEVFKHCQCLMTAFTA